MDSLGLGTDDVLTFFLVSLPEETLVLFLALRMAGIRAEARPLRLLLSGTGLALAFFLAWKLLLPRGFAPEILAQVLCTVLLLRLAWRIPLPFAALVSGIVMTLILAIQSALLALLPLVVTRSGLVLPFGTRLLLSCLEMLVLFLAAFLLGSRELSILEKRPRHGARNIQFAGWKAVALSGQIALMLSFLAFGLTCILDLGSRPGTIGSISLLMTLASLALALGITSTVIYVFVLRESQARQEADRSLASLTDRLPGIVYRRRLDPGMTVLVAHSGGPATSLAGSLRDPADPGLVGLPWRSLVHPEDLERFDQALEPEGRAGREYSLEYRLCLPGKEPCWVWDRGVALGEAAVPVYEGFAADISARKAAEADLARAGREKEQLMRELFHRTGNAMQSVSSLMHLKAMHANDGKVESLFEDLALRIDALSLAQDALRYSDDLFVLDLERYLRDLVAGIQVRAAWFAGVVEVSLETADCQISIDAAGPLGIVLTELLVNSARHGTAGRERCAVRLSAGPASGNELRLSYDDDGPGLPEDFDLGGVEGLGLPLSEGIVRGQLKGSFVLGPGPGFHCRLSFPALVRRLPTGEAGQGGKVLADR